MVKINKNKLLLTASFLLQAQILVAILLVFIFISDTKEENFILFAINISFLSLAPLLTVLLWARKNDDSFEITDKKDRYVPYAVALLFYLICSVLSYRIQNIGVYSYVSVSYLFGVIVMAAGNYFTKISVHASGIAIFSAIAVCLFWPWGMFTILLIPFISWIRFSAGKHTIPQLIIGAIVGLAVPISLYMIMF